MVVQILSEAQMALTIPLFKKFFPVHNRFQSDDETILGYLKGQAQDNTLVGLLDDEQIKAAMFIVETGRNSDGTHRRYKFRHFAFDSDEAAKQLLTYGEQWITQQSPTAKVAHTIAETEPGMEFYLNNGYTKEASLADHYRWGETCYILGKSLKG